MKTAPLLALVASVCLSAAALVACGDSSDTTDSTATGGTAGAAGMSGSSGQAGAGTGGTAGGSAGAGTAGAGAGGEAGAGGQSSAGMSGTSGQSGTAGQGGQAGSAGEAGSGGEAGAGGTAGAAGVSGASGQSGAAGSTQGASVAWQDKPTEPTTIKGDIALDYGFFYEVQLKGQPASDFQIELERCRQLAGADETCSQGAKQATQEGKSAIKFGIDPDSYAQGENHYRMTLRLYQRDALVSADTLDLTVIVTE